MAKKANQNTEPAESLESLLARAENQLFLKQIKEAKAAYQKAVQNYPDDWRAHFGLVKLHTANFSDYVVPEDRYAQDLVRARETASERDRVLLEAEYRHYGHKRQEALEREQKKAEERHRTGGAERFKKQIEGEQKKNDARIKLIGIIAGAVLVVVVAVAVIAVFATQGSGSADTYTVTYRYTDAGGKEVVKKEKFVFGDAENGRLAAPEERAGFVFAWYLSSDCSKESRYYFDKRPSEKSFEMWTKWIVLYTVTFDSKGGTAVEPIVGEEGDAVIRPTNPTRTSQAFDGWYLDDAVFSVSAGFPLTLTRNVTLYAKWVQQYTVTFNPLGGPAVAPITRDAGVSITQEMLPSPTQTSMYFKGWFLDSECSEPVAVPFPLTDDVTLYAKWEPKPRFTVTYILNGGFMYEDEQELNEGTVIAGDGDKPTRAGYTFGGWYMDAQLAVPAPFPITLAEDLTFYAKWV